MFLADGQQTGAVDEVQGFAVGELYAAGAVARGGDYDAEGGSFVLHGAVKIADVGRRDHAYRPSALLLGLLLYE